MKKVRLEQRARNQLSHHVTRLREHADALRQIEGQGLVLKAIASEIERLTSNLPGPSSPKGMRGGLGAEVS